MKLKFWCIFVGCLVFLGSGALVCGEVSTNIEKFNHQFETCLESGTFEAEKRAYSQLWDIMDALVADVLNTDGDPEKVQDVLSQLAGYEGRKSHKSEVIGNAVFSTGTERDPNYLLWRIRIRNTDFCIGVYNDFRYDTTASLVSRMSVFCRSKDRWKKTDAFEGTETLTLYPSPYLLDHHALLTVQEYRGGDHSKGWMKIWRVSETGKLTLQEHYDELVDCQVDPDQNATTIRYSQFPKYLKEPVLGTRPRYEIRVSVANDRLASAVVCVNPWVELVGKFFGSIERRDFQLAKTYVSDPGLIAILSEEADAKQGEHTPFEGWQYSAISHEEGDIKQGTGSVDFFGGIHIDAERNQEKTWVITNMTYPKKSAEHWSAKMVDFGTYEIFNGEHIPDNSVAGGLIISYGKHLIGQSDQVVALLGVSFGYRYVLSGPDDGVEVTVRVTHPQALRDPSNGKAFAVSEWSQWVPANQTNWNTGWNFDQEWEIVPGNWLMQLLIHDTVLLEKVFIVTDGRKR